MPEFFCHFKRFIYPAPVNCFEDGLFMSLRGQLFKLSDDSITFFGRIEKFEPILNPNMNFHFGYSLPSGCPHSFRLQTLRDKGTIKLQFTCDLFDRKV